MNTIQTDQPTIDFICRQLSQIKKTLEEKKDIFNELLSAKDAEAYMHVSKRYLQTLRDRQELAFIQRGQLILYRKSELDRWLAEHEVKITKR
ncbi:helix-turn-helix domain-containing protein [Dyadobacter sp. CY312]|uniref:helix-turn-helix domain-containing protein n=1 Tax=Dyadobacter sp. CY312 TaxID=2907303 RepID=UPI001F1B734B|nr:helix-turn-helix domain-containing protein [Dyadobacter sp. CY312]MCE7038976.1 helix-turn-helix domain-containing protein [Dyadobacter sp. CY312]